MYPTKLKLLHYLSMYEERSNCNYNSCVFIWGIFTLNSQLAFAKDGSSEKNCAAKKTISNTPDPTIQKVMPIAKTEDNSLTTISTQADNINDNTLLIQLNDST